MTGVEGNEEMVVAGKPGLRHLGKHLADQAAQGFLREHVVAHQVFRHGRNLVASEGACNTRGGKGSGGFCCQVPPNPA